MKKRVSYTVLSIILMIAVGVFGYFAHSISASVDKIERSVVKVSDAYGDCRSITVKLEAKQEQLVKSMDKVEAQVLRNVTQLKPSRDANAHD